jgi:hypothetical protein
MYSSRDGRKRARERESERARERESERARERESERARETRQVCVVFDVMRRQAVERRADREGMGFTICLLQFRRTQTHLHRERERERERGGKERVRH